MARRLGLWPRLGVAALVLLLGAGRAGAHAFPARSDPRTGAVTRTAPAQVQIWFDGDIEAAFSTIRVLTATGQRVDKGDAQGDPQNHRLLRVTLPPGLAPGVYKVFWSVLAVDGHRTEGDYTFTLKPPE